MLISLRPKARVALVVVFAGCVSPQEAGPSSPAHAPIVTAPASMRADDSSHAAAPAAPATEPTADVELEPIGNRDPRGVEDQPDWNREAQLLRERVIPLFQETPRPTQRHAACLAMHRAAEAFYAALESSVEQRTQLKKRWRSTRDADVGACESELSDDAIACVTILLAARNAEYAWLVDQCDRAFPRAPQ
jgi:hypothetical protein